MKDINRKKLSFFAYTFGIIGALILGTGMCLAMKVIGDIMWLGIVIGVVGIAMVSINYVLYKIILKSAKQNIQKKFWNLVNKL